MQNIYHKLSNITVRDLYWLLFSEPPLSVNYDLSPFALFPQSILEEWKLLSEAYFLELDRNPNALIHFTDRKKNKRLGFYAEALLSYFFQTFNEVDLLLQNIQVFDQQRTIGEVDFIILYKKQVIHLECAVKYYLLENTHAENEASNWVGPRRKDNLALKLDKLIQHQLPLGSRREIQEKTNRSVDISYLFLKGIFFSEKELPSNKINGGRSHQFIHQWELHEFRVKPVEILIRPNWLSATSPSFNKNDQPIQFEQTLTNPLMVLFQDNKVRFVVPDDWGDK
jgi:hypothetical protein